MASMNELKALGRVRGSLAHQGKEAAQEREGVEDQTRWERYAETGVFIDNDEMMSWLDELANEARRLT